MDVSLLTTYMRWDQDADIIKNKTQAVLEHHHPSSAMGDVSNGPENRHAGDDEELRMSTHDIILQLENLPVELSHLVASFCPDSILWRSCMALWDSCTGTCQVE